MRFCCIKVLFRVICWTGVKKIIHYTEVFIIQRFIVLRFHCLPFMERVGSKVSFFSEGFDINFQSGEILPLPLSVNLLIYHQRLIISSCLSNENVCPQSLPSVRQAILFTRVLTLVLQGVGLNSSVGVTSDLRFYIVLTCLQKTLSKLFVINYLIPLQN